MIVISYESIWYVYAIALLLIAGIIVLIIYLRIRHKNKIKELRKIYQSNYRR